MLPAAKKKQCRKPSPRSANGANAFSFPSGAAAPGAFASPPVGVGGGTLVPSVPSPNTLLALLTGGMALGGDATPALGGDATLGVVAPARASNTRTPTLSSIDKYELSEKRFKEKKIDFEAQQSKLKSQHESQSRKLEETKKEWAERVELGYRLDTIHEENTQELSRLNSYVNFLKQSLGFWQAQKQAKEEQCNESKGNADTNAELAAGLKYEISNIEDDLHLTDLKLINVGGNLKKLAIREPS